MHFNESKLPGIGTSIFSVMSSLAAQHQAVNLGQGFPDFPTDAALLNLATESMIRLENQYAPANGLSSLRQAVAQGIQSWYQINIDPETEITITSGATEALFCAITAFVQPDDEVIVFEPAYDSYVPVITLCGARPVFYSLEAPDFSIDWDHVKKLVNPRTRMIIINNPHNPTGKTWSRSDLIELEHIVNGQDIFVLGDEVYEHIIFDDRKHAPVFSFPGLRDQSICVSSFGKSFHVTGWKVGYLVAPPTLMAEIRKVHQFVTFCTSTPFQHAIAGYMQERNDWRTELAGMYQAKRDLFQSLLTHNDLKLIPTEGTYFMVLDYKGISKEKDTVIARKLTTELGIATIPMSVFYHNGFHQHLLRICFAKRDETLAEGARRLNNWV